MILLLLACVEGPGEPVALPEADRDLFDATAAPILEAGCGTPSCHGSSSRPLEIYASPWHRLDPAEVHRESPLTEEERQRNFDRARAFLDAADPDLSLLLLEPLAPAAGGTEHAGIVVYEDTGEPDWLALRDWAWTAEAP